MNALANLHVYLGDLNQVKRVVKTLAFVACTPEFSQQPKVIDGASRLMADIFGEELGIGVRSALGTNALPGNIPVEIEFIFERK